MSIVTIGLLGVVNTPGGMAISALVPFADLMNHAHSPSVSWSWDSGSGEIAQRCRFSKALNRCLRALQGNL